MAEKSKNLKPIRSVDEAREKGKKGGIKSGEVRREKKELRGLFETFLNMDAPPKMKQKAEEILPELSNKKLSLKATLVICLIEKIMNGDTKAFELMRDTIGEKPVEKQEITGKEGEPLVINGFASMEDAVKHFKEMIGE